MPKIAEIEDTPNPNALKFTLREALTWGLPHSYENAEQAEGDELARALFAIEHVTNVFYVDRWLTVTQDGQADWKELVRKIAVPLRAGVTSELGSSWSEISAAGAATGSDSTNSGCSPAGSA